MGQFIGAAVPEIPTVFLQEGGYRMDKIGEAAADVVEGFSLAMKVKALESGTRVVQKSSSVASSGRVVITR
jgi:acetoin utilization deacetylase AcuC-like enzyme